MNDQIGCIGCDARDGVIRGCPIHDKRGRQGQRGRDMKTEQTANGLATYSEPTFRTYEPYTVTESDGTAVTLQLCEDLVEGRWEPFVSVVR
jgi:hypothetical protein